MRRFARGHSKTLLPLHVNHLSNTISCWYCEFKSSSFNQPLFLFGRKYARNLRAWFSIGVGFSLTAVVGVSMILLWESARVLHLYNGNTHVVSLLSGSLFGVSPWVSGFSVTFANVGYMLIASIISVCTHEVGHALAAASEGVQMEYAAVFLAVLFPGALVAFNHELLQVLSRVAALRIYCAGIWHNAAFCAVCALIWFFLPLILYPFFLYNETPMVLDVSSSSPLHGYLSTGDLIITLDGIRVRKSEEWTRITSLLDEQTNSQYPKNDSNINIMGYCVPISLINKYNHIQVADNKTSCPNELNLFTTTSCLDSTIDGVHCLPAKDIVTLSKCQSAESNCTCSEDEYCLSPVQMPGSTWVEIKYSTPYPPKCHRLENKTSQYNKSSDINEFNCGGTFVFIGDIKSMSRSIMLTFYRPRWSSSFGANFPNMLEKLLICTFNVSLTLALLNSLPVYFLDGESIMEMTLFFFSSLSPRQRRNILQSCLLGGTAVSILVFIRISFLVIL